MSLFSHVEWYPFAYFGLTSPAWAVNLDTLLYTWVAMLFLCGGALIVRRYYFSHTGRVYAALEFFTQTIATMCVDSIGYFRRDYFMFIASLFLFTLSCCVVGILPFMDEATKDVNTTFAIAIASFVYVSYQQLTQLGPLKFLEQFLGHHEMPLVIRIIMSPLETMGKFSKIISMAFRLFGNVLGGAVVYHLILSMLFAGKVYFLGAVAVGGIVWLVVFRQMHLDAHTRLGKILYFAIQSLFIITGVQFFFGIFESLIQAFVVAMLSMTYLALGISHDVRRDRKAVVWN